jgi:mannose-1-phosphate guanylyltransferase
MNQLYAVILAGGSGTRFWPKSRHLRPKQLCRIGSGEWTMIESTLRRIDGFIPPDRRLIVTHQDQAVLTREIVGNSCARILAEPEARNTAAALAMAAIEIANQNPNAVMISFHADHVIRDEARFLNDLNAAVEIAQSGYLTLVGIQPTRPETGYGYIERGNELGGNLRGSKVLQFKEKPNLETAKSYLSSGKFLWNSGLFVWKVSTIIEELRKYLPHTLDTLNQVLKDSGAKSFNDVLPAKLSEAYGRLQKLAIDNAILEVSQKVAVVASDCGWFDVGSWSSLADCFGADANGNYLNGDVLVLDTQNSTIDSDGPFVATIGLNEMIVVAMKDAVLVCPQSRSQDVKSIVEELKKRKRTQLT